MVGKNAKFGVLNFPGKLKNLWYESGYVNHSKESKKTYLVLHLDNSQIGW